MANLKNSKSQSMGLHKEVLKGRTQQVFFNPEEAENFFYYGAYDVDFNKRTEVDAKDLSCKELNSKIHSFMKEGYGTVVVKLAEAYGCVGIRAKNPDELDEKIQEMINIDKPVIFDCQVDQAENCFPMIPSGKPHNQMLLGPKDQEENKITGKGKALV